MTTQKCSICNNNMSAEIKDLGSYNSHTVPVWFCPTCNISTTATKENRKEWVDTYAWKPPGIVYGIKMSKDIKCAACSSNKVVASMSFMLTCLFPVVEIDVPSWQCCECGFSDHAVKEDRYIWADKYKGWK